MPILISNTGRVTTERGDIGDDEPVVLFRGQDQLLPDLLRKYLLDCIDAGSPIGHLKKIREVLSQIEEWQAVNRTKVPD